MLTRQQYLEKLEKLIQAIYKCGAVHRETLYVTDWVEGMFVWLGDVELFELRGHPEAKRCYAWREGGTGEKGEKWLAILELPPVNSPLAAVKSSRER